MGNTNQKESLYDAINADDTELVTQILKLYPKWVNEPISDDIQTTPLGRAAWRGNVEMIYTLIEHGADVNIVGPQQVSPLQWAAQRGKDEAVDFLVQKGAKLDFISKDRLNALDYSILYGSYNTAWKLMNLGLEPKGLDFYKLLANEKHVLFYDYEKMLEHLHRKVPLEECPPFNIAPPDDEVKFKDPVIDPRETWTEFAKRVLEFEDPPLVEREDLPAEWRPENRYLGRLRSLINGVSPFPPEENKEDVEKADVKTIVTEEEKQHADDKQVAEQFNHAININDAPDSETARGEESQKEEESEKEGTKIEENRSPVNRVQPLEIAPVQVEVENNEQP